MIIYLYGPDSYQRGEKLRALIRAYKEKHAHADFFSVDVNEDKDAWRTVKEFVVQPSMFAETKLLVVYGSCSIKEKEWIAFLKKLQNNKRVFALLSDAGAPAKPFSFLLGADVRHQHFPELTGATLTSFVEREAIKREISFDSNGLRAFVEVLQEEPDSGWHATHELDKFSFVKEKKPFTVDDVGKLLSTFPVGRVTTFTRTLALEKDTWKKLVALETALAVTGAPPYVFNSLAYQIRGDDVVRCADYDISVKSGVLEYEEALTDFALTNVFGERGARSEI